MATLYDKLGVEPKASAEEITRAYRRLAMKYHPDRHPAGSKAAAQSAFYEIGTAFETLSDGERRAQYDEKLRLAEKLKEASRQQDQHRAFYEGWVKLAVSLTASGQDRAAVCKALLAQGCPQKNAEHIAQMAMIRRAHFSRGRPRPRSKRFWRMPRLKHKGAPVEAADKAALIRRRLQRYGIAGASIALLLAVGIASTMVGEDDAADVAAPVHALAPHPAPGPTRAAQATGRPADPGTAALLAASGTTPSKGAPEALASASDSGGTDGGIDALVDDLADASAAPAMAANASAAAAAAAEADAQVSPIQSQIAHFDQATGTGTMTYAQLPAGAEFAAFRTQLQAPFTIRLLTTRLLGANPRRVLYLFASTSADKAQADCDHCKALISAMVTQQVDKNSEAVVTPLEVLAAMGSHGGYDARANRPSIVEVGPGKQGLILKDVTNRNGAIRESAVFFALETDRIARLGTLVTRIDMTDTAECAAHHSPRVPVDMMCPNWSASYFFVRDRKDSMYPLSAHALGTEWLVPSHTPFPVDEQHVVVPDGHGHFVETAEHHDGATPTVAAELLGKPRVATAPPRRVVNSAPGARAHTGHTLQAASRSHGASPGPASRTAQAARQKSHGTVLPPLTASARRQPVLFNADADAAY